MRRRARIHALLQKCRTDAAALDAMYAASRANETLGDPAKVLIKNILENLRSCLDYMAHDIFEALCRTRAKPDKLYFPIRGTRAAFESAMHKSLPGVNSVSPVYSALEAVQPYSGHDQWLSHLNRLNNFNKHDDLADHIHMAAKSVTIEREGAVVAIGPAVGIAPGASFLGVAVDPVTRLPGPSCGATVTVEPWANFYFEGMACPVTVFVGDSIRKMEHLILAVDAAL